MENEETDESRIGGDSICGGLLNSGGSVLFYHRMTSGGRMLAATHERYPIFGHRDITSSCIRLHEAADSGISKKHVLD